jgi:hypothetical protein
MAIGSTSSIYKLAGSYTTEPAQGNPSGKTSDSAFINEVMFLSTKTTCELFLTDNNPLDVPFGGVVEANVVMLKSVGGPIEVKITSELGTEQIIPVDGFFQLITISKPVSQISVTRLTSANTLVNVFLGEKA